MWYIDFLTLKKGNYEMPIVVQDYLQLFRRRRRRRREIEEEAEEDDYDNEAEETTHSRAPSCFSVHRRSRISIVKIEIASRNVSALSLAR